MNFKKFHAMAAAILVIAACTPVQGGKQEPTPNPNPNPNPGVELNVVVTTGAAESVTFSSATITGSYSNANATVRECGFDWDVTDQIGMSAQADLAESFSYTLEELEPETTYYYRAYVALQSGETIQYFYGEIKSFTTESHTVIPPAPSNVPVWAELPVMDVKESSSYLISESDPTLYYAWHYTPDLRGPGGKQARNYTVCYSADHHCPVWVAAPRHSMYVGGANRTNAYGKDPDVPSDIQYHSKSTGGGCNKGHMLGSAERTGSSETNRQVFYYTNIAPQLSSGFNTGGGGWNLLEDWVDTQVCADTLYEVVGCYFDQYTDGYGMSASPKKISFGDRSDVSIPTMFYYVLLRTKKGSSGKAVKDCSASELKCAAFVRTHTNSLKGQKPSSREMMSVADLEKITGVTYFPNVPNAPKSTYSASDWGL